FHVTGVQTCALPIFNVGQEERVDGGVGDTHYNRRATGIIEDNDGGGSSGVSIVDLVAEWTFAALDEGHAIIKGVSREGGAAQFIAGIYISIIDNVSLNVGREFSRTIQPAHGGNVLQLSRHRFWACDVERIGNDTRNGGVGDRYHPGGVGGGTDCACAGAIVTRGGGHKDASIAG